eukprot:scaffold214257_cov15-Tisochrysis_lutea.AAC.1
MTGAVVAAAAVPVRVHLACSCCRQVGAPPAHGLNGFLEGEEGGIENLPGHLVPYVLAAWAAARLGVETAAGNAAGTAAGTGAGGADTGALRDGADAVAERGGVAAGLPAAALVQGWHAGLWRSG